MSANRESVEELREKIEALKRRWPAHSVSPALMQELDDLEEALARALEEAGESSEPADPSESPTT